MSKTVRDVMHPNPECIQPDASLYDACVKMASSNVGTLPIIDPSSKKPLGIVTDRDIVIMGIAKHKDINMKVSEIMSKNLVYVSPSESVEDAAKKLKEKQVRRLLITENEKCVGILSLGDLACKCHGMPAEKVVMDALYEISKKSTSQTSE